MTSIPEKTRQEIYDLALFLKSLFLFLASFVVVMALALVIHPEGDGWVKTVIVFFAISIMFYFPVSFLVLKKYPRMYKSVAFWGVFLVTLSFYFVGDGSFRFFNNVALFLEAIAFLHFALMDLCTLERVKKIRTMVFEKDRGTHA